MFFDLQYPTLNREPGALNGDPVGAMRTYEDHKNAKPCFQSFSL